jgi:hypothetical protein
VSKLENPKTFGRVYAKLTQAEEYGLHLPIGKIADYEESAPDEKGRKRGRTKMDL